MNEYEEALNIFCEQNVFKDISKDVLEEKYKLLKELVEKATPKKVKKSKPLEDDVTIGKAIFCKGTTLLTKCPNCDAWLNPLYHKEYCGNCGQKVSWESEENE